MPFDAPPAEIPFEGRTLPDRTTALRNLAWLLRPDGIYKLVRVYSALLGFEIGAHALRATAAR